MTIDEAQIMLRAKAKCIERICKGIYEDCNEQKCDNCDLCYAQGTNGEQIELMLQCAEWLEELKELREYKKRMEMQDMDDINNPLEPLKLVKALESEIFKYNYRKEHKPQDINILDYTVMYALKHCLEEQLKERTEK